MDLTPQGYPLIAETEDGDEHLVVGWTTVRLAPGVFDESLATVHRVQPVAVPVVGGGRPVRLDGELTYRLPS